MTITNCTRAELLDALERAGLGGDELVLRGSRSPNEPTGRKPGWEEDRCSRSTSSRRRE